jgi:hypothetical protein
MSEKTFSGYLSANPNSGCHICMTCAICRGLWELFDPESPGEYNGPCSTCKALLAPFKERLGKNDGAIYFSHSTIPDEKLADLTSRLLKEDKIKKVDILQVPGTKVSREKGIVANLSSKVTNVSDFVRLIGEGGFRPSVIYEVRKDKYF